MSRGRNGCAKCNQKTAGDALAFPQANPCGAPVRVRSSSEAGFPRALTVSGRMPLACVGHVRCCPDYNYII